MFVDNKVIASGNLMTITDRCKKRLEEYPYLYIQPIKWLNKPWTVETVGENEVWKFTQPKEGDKLKFEVGLPMKAQTVLKMVKASPKEAKKGKMTGTKIHIPDSKFEYDSDD